MELYFFKNKIIREVKEELIHCFAYSDFDLSADLCGLNLKPFIDAGIDISNTSLTFDLKTKEWKEVLIILLNYFLSCTYIVFPLFLFFLLFVRICNIAETYITS